MTSYVLVRKSMLAARQRDASATIRFARAAQEPRRLPSRIRAVALMEEGYGLALAGQTPAWQRRMDEAAKLAGMATNCDDDTIARYCVPEFIEVWGATSLLEFGRYAQAIDTLDRAIATLPSIYYRDRGNYLGRLGTAYASAGAPEEALTCGREAQDIARETGSKWIAYELEKLQQKLDPWAHRADVIDFTQSLTVDTYIRGSGGSSP